MNKHDDRAQSPVSVTKLGYVGIETPDLDRMIEYYEKVLDFALVERTADEAFLTTAFDHHSIALKRGVSRPRMYVGYEIEGDLADAKKRLTGLGIPVEIQHDISPATPEVLVVAEPETGTPLHLFNGQVSSNIDGYTPLRPTKLGHIASFCENLDTLQNFYQDLLGFKWADTVSDFFVFMRCNSDHHAANFMSSAKYQGMHHVAFEMRDVNHLQSLLDHMSTNKYRLEWGPGRHGPGHNIFTYHKDPDGNTVELFTQLDSIIDEQGGYFEPRPWHEDSPQYPKTWEADLANINSWGPVNFEYIDH